MTTDCVVIGGGIIGVMTARILAKAGLKVQVLEKQQVGRESSWAGGGLLSPIYPWDAPEVLWPLISRGNEVYPQLCEDLLNETGIDPEYVQSGLLNFDSIETDKLYYWAKETDTSYQRVDQKQLTEIEAAVNPLYEFATWVPEIAQVRNPRLLKALKNSLLNNKKVQIKEGIEVQAVNQVKERVSSVKTSEGKISCQYVVVAAGAWSGTFLKDETRIQPVRGQMLRIEAPKGLLQRVLMCDSTYLIPRQDGQILIGSSLEYVGFDKSTTEEVAKKLYTNAIKILPELQNFPIAQQWAGLRPGSENGIPLIEESDEVKGLFINSGHFRNGVGLAPASCEMLVDKMLSSE